MRLPLRGVFESQYFDKNSLPSYHAGGRMGMMAEEDRGRRTNYDDGFVVVVVAKKIHD